MKTYFKSLFRSLKKNVSRFISVIVIVLIGVGLSSGVGSSTSKLKQSVSYFAKERKVSDVTIKSKSDSGFTDEQITAIVDRYGEDSVSYGACYEVYLENGTEQRLTRLYFYDDTDDRKINLYASEEGSSENTGGIVAFSEKSDKGVKGRKIGEKIVLDYKDIFEQLSKRAGKALTEEQKAMLDFIKPVTVEVAKIVEDPRYFSNEKEPSYIKNEETDEYETLDDVLYLPSAALVLLPAKNEINVCISSDKNVFSSSYKKDVESMKQEIKALLGCTDEEIAFLTLEENFSFRSFDGYTDKIHMLAWLLVCAFMFITALVVTSNVTRLIDEERSLSACLISLGYSPSTVISKYLIFVILATLIGGVAAYFVGTGLCSFIYLVFNFSFAMPPEHGVFAVAFFMITFIFILVTVTLTTLFSGIKIAKETPANLMRPKAPPAGKKVVIEKIPFIWNNLSFKYKSSCRNVLRYFNRFLMTVIAVAGSTGLVMAGTELLDLCLFGNFGNQSIAWLAVVVVIFAAMLTFTAIYTITNISVSEREREIATLMVLGYYDNEVCGYIYREIYIDAIIGIIFGYGVGILLMNVLFNIMESGSISTVSWRVWLAAPVLVLVFTSIVALFLKKRITSVDMNASLKAVE